MSARDKDARAAMREIIRAGAAEARVTDSDGKQVIQWSIPGDGDVARTAFAVADAMAAERAKRETPEAPVAAPLPDDDRPLGSWGMTSFVGFVHTVKGPDEDDLGVITSGTFHVGERVAVVRVHDLDDKLKAIASENAKLRAVAEAAARLQRLRNSNRPDGIGEASLQLDGALGNWLPGWRTK